MRRLVGRARRYWRPAHSGKETLAISTSTEDPDDARAAIGRNPQKGCAGASRCLVRTIGSRRRAPCRRQKRLAGRDGVSSGRKGYEVPPGFATTADAYWQFVEFNDLRETIIGFLGDLGSGKPRLPKRVPRSAALSSAAHGRRTSRTRSHQPTGALPALRQATTRMWRCAQARPRKILPDASFAGQQEILSQYSRRERRCSMLAGAAMHRSSPTGPSATGRPRASII